MAIERLFYTTIGPVRWWPVDIVVVACNVIGSVSTKKLLLTVQNEKCCRPIRRERVRSKLNVPQSKRHTRAPQVGH